MAYTKYPEEIQYYHDLFEGDFFLPENQKIFSDISKKLKKKIYTILSKEATISADISSLSSDPTGDIKHEVRLDHISHGKGRQNPIAYITKLEQSDRDNLYKILFEVFYNEGKGLYRNRINRVFVIGSSTYDTEYWNELSQGPWKNDTAIQQRVAKKGNDIDLLIGANLFVSPYLLNSYGAIPNKHHDNRIAILNFVCSLLSKHDIPYTIENHRKDGTSHLWLKNTHTGDIITHTGKIMDYHRPNVIVQLPSGRPIHIVADGEDIHGAYKREFLEGRDYVCLFDGAEQRYFCKDVFEKVATGENVQIPETLEERYQVLQKNKRNRYTRRLEHTQKKLIERRENIKRPRTDSPFDDLGF